MEVDEDTDRIFGTAMGWDREVVFDETVWVMSLRGPMRSATDATLVDDTVAASRRRRSQIARDHPDWTAESRVAISVWVTEL